ncbi:winged helix-turn-helix domain-containing protein [Microlunatus capsulatus]|uniref:DNA-binding transcriptional ArsR family regulator n=1 Tax=Microlunatus capsulatus TaxID=99117 RepID=A0ABS4ZAJ9_9ACTN|nr:helix-turn-helix domain-containing protein [Microlunatus capsulatus]MBP2418081.1 DNA-binding transcriptional ArsR family regulator [Microlunatus capsulatus]
MDPTDEVLADLQERVRRLEARLGADEGARPAPDAEPSAGTFWLLEALRAQGLAGAVAFGGTAADAEGGPVSWQITRSAEDLTGTDWAVSVPALAALGHPSRMQILQLVATGRARTAAELAHAEGLGTTGQIYHHLRQLVAGGWLRVTTRGQHQVPAERLVPLLVVLAATAGP